MMRCLDEIWTNLELTNQFLCVFSCLSTPNHNWQSFKTLYSKLAPQHYYMPLYSPLPLKFVQTPNWENKFEWCLLSLRVNSAIKKPLSFFQSQCHSFGSYGCWAAGPCLVTLSFAKQQNKGTRQITTINHLMSEHQRSHSIAMHCHRNNHRPPPFTALNWIWNNIHSSSTGVAFCYKNGF